MRNVSDVTGIAYEEEDCVFFRNIFQIIFYLEKGCPIVDLFVDGAGKLVFVFRKADHEKYIKLWMENKNK
jgi:hypothetical protein